MTTFQTIVMYGHQAFLWMGALLAGAIARWITNHQKAGIARDIELRALREVGGAVTEVEQVYVAGITNGGQKLTPEQAAKAKADAIATVKANLGEKGLKRLAAILGLEDVTNWIAGKIESAVGSMPSSTASAAKPEAAKVPLVPAPLPPAPTA